MSRMFHEVTGNKIFRTIPDFPDYYASKDGVILSTKRSFPYVLSQIKDPRPSVRELRTNEGQSLRILARQYGVSHTTIRRAALGISWSHVTENPLQSKV